MSKNEGSSSSFMISFVCFILAYIINIPFIHHDDVANSAVINSAFFGGIILAFMGLVMAFLGIAKSTEKNNQQQNTVFLPPPMPPLTKQVAVLREKRCHKCGEKNHISAKSCTMCMYDF